MIRLQDIQKALLPVVGWQQDYNPEKQIDNELCQSESGLTFQGAHPLCTLANVRAIMPDDYLYSYPAWNQIMTYKRGTKVRHNGIVWIANYDNTGIVPAATDFNQDFNNDFGSELAGAWVKYDMVSDFVRNLTVNGINTAVQNFIQEKQLQQETKNLLERRTFFDGAARLAATIDPTGKIVGFEIVPVRAMGVTTKIERIGLQMVGATGTVRLYLFHSSQVEPMRVIDLAFTNTKGGFQWFTPTEPIYLPYIPGDDGNGNDAGGAWFLCYNQNELPAGMRDQVFTGFPVRDSRTVGFRRIPGNVRYWPNRLHEHDELRNERRNIRWLRHFRFHHFPTGHIRNGNPKTGRGKRVAHNRDESGCSG